MANQATPENNESIPEASDKEKNSSSESLSKSLDNAEIEQLKKELNEYKDKYLRSIAEAENLRKRMNKERHDMTQLAIQSVILDFLDPIDHLESALSHMNGMSEDVKNWAIGFKMILNQFKDALAANDVHPFKSEGIAFDPHHHEAIEMVETVQFPAGMIIEESTRGYKMGSKTIRPPRVKVAKQPMSKKTNQTDSQLSEPTASTEQDDRED